MDGGVYAWWGAVLPCQGSGGGSNLIRQQIRGFVVPPDHGSNNGLWNTSEPLTTRKTRKPNNAGGAGAHAAVGDIPHSGDVVVVWVIVSTDRCMKRKWRVEERR